MGNECANRLAWEAIHAKWDIQLLTQPPRAIQSVLVSDFRLFRFCIGLRPHILPKNERLMTDIARNGITGVFHSPSVTEHFDWRLRSPRLVVLQCDSLITLTKDNFFFLSNCSCHDRLQLVFLPYF